jgi:hypothetical protein
MPRITAGGPDDPSLDEIKTIDLSDKDIAKMSDEQLAEHIKMLRGNRESAPIRGQKSPRTPKSNPNVDDSTDDFV